MCSLPEFSKFHYTHANLSLCLFYLLLLTFIKNTAVHESIPAFWQILGYHSSFRVQSRNDRPFSFNSCILSVLLNPVVLERFSEPHIIKLLLSLTQWCLIENGVSPTYGYTIHKFPSLHMLHIPSVMVLAWIQVCSLSDWG